MSEHIALLIGRPNVGKSHLFCLLTGKMVETANYHGTTLQINTANIKNTDIALYDTVGIYTARDHNNSTLELLQTVESQNTITVLVCTQDGIRSDCRLYNELISSGVHIDAIYLDGCQHQQRLAEIFGCRVYSNPSLLKKSLIAPPNRPAASQPPYLHTDVDVDAAEELLSAERLPRQHVLDRWLLHPVFGLAILLFLGWLFFYQVIGVWISGDLVDLTYRELFVARVIPYIQGHVQLYMGTDTLLHALLFGRYGLFTFTLSYVLGLLLPMIWFFYVIWSLWEDSGYLPRLAALTDILFKHIGLNGRAIIPLALGFGCVTVAAMSARLLSSKTERFILLILLSVSIPCSAQLAVIQSLLAGAGNFFAWLLWLLTITFVMFALGWCMSRLLRTVPTPLFIELPRLQLPSPRIATTKANHKTIDFLSDIWLAFIVTSVVLAVLDHYGLIVYIVRCFEPLVVNVLHLPRELALSFLLGIIRRDFGAFGLLDAHLTYVQLVTASVSITLFVPCIASVVAVSRELGWWRGLFIWFFSIVISLGVGGVLTRVLEFVSNF